MLPQSDPPNFHRLRAESETLCTKLDAARQEFEDGNLSFEQLKDRGYQERAAVLAEAMLPFVPRTDPRITVEFEDRGLRRIHSSDLELIKELRLNLTLTFGHFLFIVNHIIKVALFHLIVIVHTMQLHHCFVKLQSLYGLGGQLIKLVKIIRRFVLYILLIDNLLIILISLGLLQNFLPLLNDQ